MYELDYPELLKDKAERIKKANLKASAVNVPCDLADPEWKNELLTFGYEKHFMDIMNGSYAQTHFPCKLWDAGEKGLTLSAFEWEKDRKTLIYGQVDYMYGEALYKPEMKEGNPIRLYSLDEITEIFCKLGLRICNSFADFSGKPSSDNDIQLMVYSIRE